MKMQHAKKGMKISREKRMLKDARDPMKKIRPLGIDNRKTRILSSTSTLLSSRSTCGLLNAPEKNDMISI